MPPLAQGFNIFYREARPTDAQTLLLLHGFPSASHMFRDLVPGASFRLVRISKVQWPLQRPASKVYDVGVGDIGLLQRRRSENDLCSSSVPKPRRRSHGTEIAYVGLGEGDPIVLLHGNP